MCSVDTSAMTDSVITDSCPPADTNHVPTQPSYDDTRPAGELQWDSHSAAVTTDENPTTAVVRVNGYTGHSDSGDHLTENCGTTKNDVMNGPNTVDGDVDCTKLCSTDFRTDGCGGPDHKNSRSTAPPVLTNGHADL